MSYNKPPCLLRDWKQTRLTDKSPFLVAIEERQAKARERIPPRASVTRLHPIEPSGGR